MVAHSLEDDEKFDGTCTPPLTHVLSSEEYNSSWDKLHITTRKTMLSTSPQHTQSRLRTFLLIGLLVSQSIGVIGFFTSVFISLGPYVSSDSDRGYQDTLGYLVIFTIATVFEVYIAIDSLVSQNAPQLVALCLFEGSMTGFGAVEALAYDDTISTIPPSLLNSIKWRLYVVPAIIGVATVIMSWLTWHFSQDFGGSNLASWHAYKKLGANIALRKAMRVKSVFYLLQKFCFFFLVGFCVLIVQMRKQSQGVLQTLDIVFPVLSLIVSGLVQIFTSIAVELELRFFVFIYGIFWLAALFFVGYEIIEIHPLSEATESQHTLILFSSLTILLLFSKMIVSIFCHMNFNKGLKGADLMPSNVMVDLNCKIHTLSGFSPKKQASKLAPHIRLNQLTSSSDEQSWTEPKAHINIIGAVST
ncbi:hypothetical protein PSHT_14817 [Puccinia striiformis]|uniref:Uncharacterized protein n=1 Tax=Puccinia striiformis TaxID=27350 RepID=A0A2S4UID0_9BASI|nr:hypothetical protein PSHT_14817 [Puccinia striiformis]